MRKDDSESIDKVIKSVFESLGYGKKLKEMELIDAWKEVIGVSVANRTEKIFLNNGKLYVKINSPVVKNELLMLKEGIKVALNNKVKANIVKEIIIY
ncbi:MAG: DUF721 domain-containing protein [Marinifilaceae bacterium]